ncbi:MAG: CPBP family intramembrane glutamic endopeptidase [Acidimicrobiales bacterium]
MNVLEPGESKNQVRAGMIVLGCLIGFMLGEIVATLLELVGVQLAHFHGGLSALSTLANPPWWANVLGLVGLWMGFAAAIYYAHSAGGLEPLKDQWRLRAGDAWFVLLGVGCQFVVDLAYAPFHFKHLNQPVTHLFGGSRGVTFAVVAALTTIAAPVMEEWFFRGVLFRALDVGISRFVARGGAVLAVIVSAGLFALAHAEPLQFAGLALLGVVLAILVKRTERLTPSVITHVSFNAVAMVSLLLQRAGH